MFAVLIHNVHGGHLNNMKKQSNYRNLLRRKIFQRWDFVSPQPKFVFLTEDALSIDFQITNSRESKGRGPWAQGHTPKKNDEHRSSQTWHRHACEPGRFECLRSLQGEVHWHGIAERLIARNGCAGTRILKETNLEIAQ